MQRATAVLAKGSFRPETVIDRVVLDFEGRYRRRIVLRTVGERRILLDLATATRMNNGDALATDDGVVLVIADPEPLAEISTADRDQLIRITWHLGNRHIPTQLLGEKLRIRRDHVIEALVIRLGGAVEAIIEPFDPEGGAYDDSERHHADFPSMSEQHLYKLMSWLSPAYPIGAYTHSSGLEWAVERGLVTNRCALEEWIGDILSAGSARNDAVLFVHAYAACENGDDKRLTEIVELAAALHPSRERRLEAIAQGAAFRRIASVSTVYGSLDPLAAVSDDNLCYAIAVAVLAARHNIEMSLALTAYLHALVGNLVSAAQRLVPLGQTDGQKAIAVLEVEVAKLLSFALQSVDGDLYDALGSSTLIADFASLAHETQYTRLFRT